MQRLKKTLLNPFLLAAQGFLAGAILFAATHPEAVGDAQEDPAAVAAAKAD